MNKSLLLALLGLWMLGSSLWHAFVIKNCSDTPSLSTPIAAAVTPLGLSIVDGANLNLSSSGNFGFKKSDATANIGSVQTSLDSLVAYLKANPSKQLTITGEYGADETNTTSYPNLGIARAEDIKAYLVKAGIPAGSLLTAGKENSLTWSPADSTSGLLAFGFAEKPAGGTTEEELASKASYEGMFKPMDLYFKTGSASYIKTKANEKFMKEAKAFLTANKDKKLLVTGHADNLGDDAINMKLSEKRANDVKEELIGLGISASQIVTDAKGETQPSTSNDTPEGRKQNRRVAVVVQ